LLNSVPLDEFIAIIKERKKRVYYLPGRKPAYFHNAFFKIAMAQKSQDFFFKFSATHYSFLFETFEKW